LPEAAAKPGQTVGLGQGNLPAGQDPIDLDPRGDDPQRLDVGLVVL